MITRLVGESSAALDNDQLTWLEALAVLAAAVLGDVVAARVGGGR